MDTGEIRRWEGAVEEASGVDSQSSVCLPSDVVLAVDRELRESGGRLIVALLVALMAGLVIGATLAMLSAVPPR